MRGFCFWASFNDWRHAAILLGGFAWATLSQTIPANLRADEPPASAPLTGEERKAQIAERNRLWKEARLLANRAGKMPDAIATALKMIAIEERLWGKDDAEIADSWEWISKKHEQQSDWPAAIKTWREVLRIRTAAGGEKHWETTDARLSLENAEIRSKLTSEQRAMLSQASSLIGQVEMLDLNKKHQEALPLAEKALSIYRTVLGERHPDTLAASDWPPSLHEGLGDYAKALPLRAARLAKTEEVYGPEHPETAFYAQALAWCQFEVGQRASSEENYKRALAIYQEVRKSDHEDVLEAIVSLATFYRLTGQPERTIPMLEAVLATRRRLLGNDNAKTRETIQYLANSYNATGQFDQVIKLRTELLEIVRRVRGADDPETATCLFELADGYQGAGQYAEPRKLIEECLKIRLNALGEEHEETLAAMEKLSDHVPPAQSLGLMQQVLEIKLRTLGKEHLSYASSLSKLAGKLNNLGDVPRAEVFYRQALAAATAALGEDNPYLSSYLQEIGTFYRNSGRLALAETYLVRCQELVEKNYGPDYMLSALYRDQLARIYQNLRKFDLAEPLVRKNIDYYTRSLGPDHPRTGAANYLLADIYRSQGKSDLARPIYEKVLAINTRDFGPDASPTSHTQINLALTLVALGKDADAVPLLKAALAGVRRQVDELSTAQSERLQFTLAGQWRGLLDLYLWLVLETDQPADAAYEQVIGWKGLLLARQQLVRTLAREPEIAPLVAQLQQTTGKLAALTLSPPPAEQIGPWREAVVALKDEKETLEAKIAAQSVSYRQTAKPATVADVQAALPVGYVLVDYLLCRDFTRATLAAPGPSDGSMRLYAFVVRPEGAVEMVSLGNAAPLEGLVDAWREGLGGNPRGAAAGQELRRIIWTPLEPKLTGAETVLISPDLMLGRLPFAALPGKEPGTYLLEERPLAVVPAAQLLAASAAAKEPETEGSLLLVGGVDYEAQGDVPAEPPSAPPPLQLAAAPQLAAARGGDDLKFTPLPGTKGEIDSIDAMYRSKFGDQGILTLSAREAAEDALRKEAAGHKYLHLATHGFFAPPKVKSALRKSVATSVPGDSLPTGLAPRSPSPPPSPPPATSGAPALTGIGATLDVADGGVIVTRLIPGGAALTDGRLKLDDLIVARAEGAGEFVSLAGKTLDEVVGLIRGTAGSKIRLKVVPAGKQEEVIYELTRVSFSVAVSPAEEGATPGLLSGIALAGANHPQPGGDDGILTAEEVATLDLSQCQLAVLSACETGLGEAAGGEGLLGLQRSFQVAGARTVIASLWKVPDAATRDLMERFYDNLWNKKLGKLAALREAQLWMIRHGAERAAIRRELASRGLEEVVSPSRSEKRLPAYFWAAFVLSGDWR